MKEINLIQGSKEWHKFRQEHIGATDASCVMNINPFKGKYDCWLEKVGMEKPAQYNEQMRRGNDLEPMARNWYENLKKEKYEAIVLQHDDMDYLSASLDGISVDRKHAIEIKCGVKSFVMAKKAEIPDYYKIQMQHQMLVTGLSEIDYVAFDGEEGIVITYQRDDAFIQRLVKECETFWYCVQNFISPLSIVKDHVIIENDDDSI